MKLFRVSCRVWFAIYIDNWFLSEVDPIDVFLISILLLNGFKAFVETCQSGLTSTKNWESRHPSEVGGSFCVWGFFDQFVHTLKWSVKITHFPKNPPMSSPLEEVTLPC